jgi:hypothetical protein
MAYRRHRYVLTARGRPMRRWPLILTSALCNWARLNPADYAAKLEPTDGGSCSKYHQVQGVSQFKTQ